MAAPSSAAGLRLGRYQVVKHLASGGMAEVLLARTSGLQGFERYVVIKRIRPAHAKEPSFVEMFLNEARLAAQLHHQNIVQVHDIGQEGNEYFFAMEYVHGEDLRHLLMEVSRRQQKVPLEHVVAIIGAVAGALHYAHEARGPDRTPLEIVHRDVTPANILVGFDGHVKVVDFGIAKAAARTQEATQAGTLKGKASYMSPEQCTGKAPVDRRSDLFALGIVLYELVTARRLFKGENDFLTMSAIVAGKVPPPRTHRPDIPPALEAIILKALAVEPAHRYQTGEEMREALEQFAGSANLYVSPSTLAGYMRQLFGERPEPWLIEGTDPNAELTIDFDGSASGMVAPPAEASNGAIPQSVAAADSSPIVRARSKAATGAPPVASAAPAKAKPMTRQIPIAAAKATAPRPTPVSSPALNVPGAPRTKPKTVQIPIATQAAAAAKPARGIEMHDDDAATVVGAVVPKSDAAGAREFDVATTVGDNDSDLEAATVVGGGGIVGDIDTGWDASRPFAIAATADLIAAEQSTKPAPAAKSPAAGTAAKPTAAGGSTSGASGAMPAASASKPGPGASSAASKSAAAGGAAAGANASTVANASGALSAGGAAKPAAAGATSGASSAISAPSASTPAAVSKSGAVSSGSGASAPSKPASAAAAGSGASSAASKPGAAGGTPSDVGGAGSGASNSAAPKSAASGASSTSGAALAAALSGAGTAAPTAAKGTLGGIPKTPVPGSLPGPVTANEPSGIPRTPPIGSKSALATTAALADTLPAGGIPKTPPVGSNRLFANAEAKVPEARTATGQESGIPRTPPIGSKSALASASPATDEASRTAGAGRKTPPPGQLTADAGRKTPLPGQLTADAKAVEAKVGDSKPSAAAANALFSKADAKASAAAFAAAAGGTFAAGGAKASAAEKEPAATTPSGAGTAKLPEPHRKQVALPGMTSSVQSEASRDAIASMLRARTDEASIAGDATDVAQDPHESPTVVHATPDEPSDSFVTVAEPLMPAELPGARPSPSPFSAERATPMPDGKRPSAPSLSRPSAHGLSTEGLPDAAAANDFDVAMDEAPGSRTGVAARILRSPARLALVAGGALLLGIVLVVALRGGHKKPATPESNLAHVDHDKNPAVETPSHDDKAEPEVAGSAAAAGDRDGSAAEAAGSAEGSAAGAAEGSAEGSPEGSGAGSAETASAGSVEAAVAERPVDTSTTKTKQTAKSSVKHVAAKTTATATPTKTATKKVVTKTAAKTQKAAVQKSQTKKPAWDPNSLLPPKKK